MSIGNLKTQGGKGTNWPWQYKMLLGLDKIAASVATNGKEYEAELVSITCAGPVPPAGTVIRLEVRVWDATTGAFTSISYYEPGSTTADPADYSGCTKTYLESGDATEATLLDILAKNTEINVALTAATAAPTMLRSSAAGLVTIAASVKSVSFYNASATDTAHVLTIDLKPGETVNFDAGGNGNKFPASTFTYDPDPAGGGSADLLVIYVV